jgi:hypothetical protein
MSNGTATAALMWEGQTTWPAVAPAAEENGDRREFP